MNVLIYKDGKYLDITSDIVSDISINERIDEVLDSGKFNLLTKEFIQTIEPFTRVIFKKDDSSQTPFFATSTCSKYMTVDGLYYHEVQLYEPTKILECWLIGTKAFSIVSDKLNYNSNYDRIRILKELIAQKYGIYLDLDDKLKSMLKEREYSFGPGTTLWDALFEIMRTEGCIPRIIFDSTMSNESFKITCDNIEELKTESSTEISNIISDISTQNVDDYCSLMEAEYSEVVDRDTLQKCVLSCRSQGEAIYKDTACLITPSKIEKMRKVAIKCDLQCKGTKMFLIPKPTFDVAFKYCNSDGWYAKETVSGEIESYHILLTNDSTNYSDFFMGKLKYYNEDYYNKLYEFLINCGWSPNATGNRYIVVYPQSADSIQATKDTDLEYYHEYNYMVVYDDDHGFKYNVNPNLICSVGQIDLSNRVLNKEQWDMLDAEKKPKYLYWESGQNYIEGFYNTYNDDFWKSIIYGKVPPFLESYIDDAEYRLSINFADNIDNVSDPAAYYWRCMLYNKNDVIFDNGGLIRYEKTIPMFSDTINTQENQYLINDQVTVVYEYLNLHRDFYKNVYEVEYYTKSPAYLKVNKSNYNCQIATSRSFNSGAATVDYNQLVPGVKRAVDMLGLPIKTITSKDDKTVGSLTQYGYIISKESTYKKIEDGSIIQSFVYNCSPNYQQIAAAIGVDTQYEATNLPQTGIVTRFIYVEHDTYLTTSRLYLALKLNKDDSNYIAKPLQMLEVDGHRLLVCETVDNYTFDYQKSESTATNYYIKKAIPYSDATNCIDNYSDSKFITLNNNFDISMLDRLPVISNDITDSSIVARNNLYLQKIYKDPRERLIFVFKHNGSLWES